MFVHSLYVECLNRFSFYFGQFSEQIHEQSFSTPPHVPMRSGDQIEPPNCEDIQEIDGDQFANGTGILATREVSHNEEKHSCLQRTEL